MYLNWSHLSIIIKVTSACLFIMQYCVSNHLHLKALLYSQLPLDYLNSSKNVVRCNAQITRLIHEYCQAFLQHKTASAHDWPSSSSSALRCERFTVFTYFTEVRWEQLSKTTLSRVAFPRTGAEYSHDLFWKQKTFSRFRISRIIWFRCWCRSLGGERELLKWHREEKKTLYTFMTPHTDSREEFRCYITSANGFIGRVWHQTAH